MQFLQAFNRQISSKSSDGRLGQWFCFATSVLILILGSLKLAHLPLSETELYFGLLLVLTVSLLTMNLGLLLRMENNSKQASHE